ncbi:hypothetical protein FQA39_LY02730 [Lamprigera yunnana]|nr:hypothetical protein FQA39_LY02730 [Lamprigera yunnana]
MIYHYSHFSPVDTCYCSANMKYSIRVFFLVQSVLLANSSINTSSLIISAKSVECDKNVTEEKFLLELQESFNGYFSCSYIFKGHDCPTFYNIHFITFHLNASNNCTSNKLEIVDNAVLCGKITGTNTYFAKEGILRMKLTLSNSKGQSFKILITRLPCYVRNYNQKIKMINDSLCCSNDYSSKHFYLSSPNFPYANNKLPDCVYHIRKASPGICRLRINFLYFWLGEVTSKGFCNKGFVVWDDRFICGCRTGLKLISSFDSNSVVKTIRLRNDDFANALRGFVLEINQDECPERITPTINQYSDNNYGTSYLSKARLVKENTYFNHFNLRIINHVYVFQEPFEYKDKEETTYINILQYKNNYLDDNDLYNCNAQAARALKILPNRILWKCSTLSAPLSLQCVQADYIEGYIQSPKYPYSYPSGLRICFNFKAQLGYCGVQIYFLDFDVDNSFQCRKDYLLISGRIRYCQKGLYNAALKYDLRNRSEEIVFITNGPSCGRGFKAVYKQIPCDEIPTNYPTTTTLPTVIYEPCGKDIENSTFVIEVYSYNQPKCFFNIIKYNEKVCGLKLRARDFNLLCGYEYLMIGDRRFCGSIDEEIKIDFNRYRLTIIYVRDHAIPVSSSLRFRIAGLQMLEECYLNIPEVEAERIVSHNEHVEEVYLKNASLDICGTILYATEDIASALCDLITRRQDTIKCIPITATILYVPQNSSESLNTTLEKAYMVDKVYAEEISCDNIYKIIPPQ